MTKNKKPLKRTPPKAPIKSVQYDLFTSFLSHDAGEVSNTIEIWDGIPKYFLTPKQQEKQRTDKGHADPYQWQYSFQGQPCMVEIQPALLRQEDGSYKAFFPSVTEELVEEALKKIFSDQHYGQHDPDRLESWVRFTLRMIHKELKKRSRERNISQIKHAISVMSRCILSLYQNGKEVYSGPILADLMTVNRDEYVADDSENYHVARLPVFLSHGINRLQYRQFNYARLMECGEQLTRWLYKRLIHRYRQASLIDTYHFLYSDVAQSSGLLQQGRERDNRRKVLSALDELQDKGVLLTYTAEDIREGRKIADVKYMTTAAPDFIREQKAANKRERENIVQARRMHLVDNSG